jgi:hypothetical protein
MSDKKNRRVEAKKSRKKGQLYMQEKGVDLIQWTRHNDPLYQVKGMDRHLKMKERK